MGSERERLLKQAEIASPGDSADKREEMEVAMQQVGQKHGPRLFPVAFPSHSFGSLLFFPALNV